MVTKHTNYLKKICNKKYAQVDKKDIKKIDALFLVLHKIKNNKKVSDYDKFLLSQLVFATLPNETRQRTAWQTSEFLQANFLSNMLVSQANAAGTSENQTNMTRAQFDQQLSNDITALRENCPQAGYENWTLLVMCSEHSWKDGVLQPIYSKEYAEAGGQCVFSEAGAMEDYRTRSLINTKMRSEYNFQDNANISNQIACSFSCGSYKCPKLEKEIGESTLCKNPIYKPNYGYRLAFQGSSSPASTRT